MIANLVFVCSVVLCQVFSYLYLSYLNKLIIIIIESIVLLQLRLILAVLCAMLALTSGLDRYNTVDRVPGTLGGTFGGHRGGQGGFNGGGGRHHNGGQGGFGGGGRHHHRHHHRHNGGQGSFFG